MPYTLAMVVVVIIIIITVIVSVIIIIILAIILIVFKISSGFLNSSWLYRDKVRFDRVVT